MSVYLMHNHPHQTASRRFSIPNTHFDGLRTTVVPLLSPNSPPATTITRVPEPSSPRPPEQQVFDQKTLAHFLQAFHTHHGNEGERDEAGTTHPRFDLAETMTGYTIYGELPGLKREDVSVQTGDLLFTITISGVLRKQVPEEVRDIPPTREHSRTRNGEEEKAKDEKWIHWHVEERHIGRFSRAFHLPVGKEDMACVKASMSDGLLVITVPKTVAEIYREEVSQERQVEIEGGENRNTA